MSRKHQNRRRIRFESLEDRKVLAAGGWLAAGDLDAGVEALFADPVPAVESSASAEQVQLTVGTLTLDPSIPGGVQNDLVLSLDTPITNTALSGTIDIGMVTAEAGQITGFTVAGGLITATDTTGLLELQGVSAVPLDINPGINPVNGGSFDAAEVGISINGGTASVSLLGLTFDFGVDPVEGPGSGTGTVIVNSVNGNDYDITVSIPIELELEVIPGVVAGVNGNIVASGIVTVPEDPSALITQFYTEIKQSIGSDSLYTDLVIDAKAAIDSGDLSQIQNVYSDVVATTTDLGAAAIDAYTSLAGGITDPAELNILYYSLTVVITELQVINDFLISALSSPAEFQDLSLGEFADELVQTVQEQLFNSPPAP